MTEWDIVELVESGFRKREVSSAFPPLAHASSVQPHREPEGKEVKGGETLLVDAGCRFRGYCSDMTRMVPNDVTGQ